LGLALGGCAATSLKSSLKSSCQVADPPVEAYHAAFEYHGDIILEYTVKNRDDGKFKRLSDKYWAELHPAMLGDQTVKGDYTVHREPLAESKRMMMHPIPIVDLRQEVPPAADGRMGFEPIFTYINRQPAQSVPQVFTCMGCGTQLYVRYRDPTTARIAVYQTDPYEVFIPASRYPKLIALYPFAFVGDILIFPFAYLNPMTHWHD
jgi:hypothetical protein